MTVPWDALGKGAALYNEGKFYEAHEVWEELWLELEDEPRLVVQGLIQAAAAGHKAFAQRQPRGCVKLLESALEKLDRSPAVFHGIDIVRFRTALRATLADAKQWLHGALPGLSRMPDLGTPYRSPTE